WVFIIERGFLTSNSKVKKNVDESVSSNDSVLGDLAKNGLAAKIKHINRKGVSNVRKAVRGVQFHTWAATSEPANTRSDQGLVHAENVPVGRQPLKSILKKTNVTNDISRSLNEGGTTDQVNANGPGNDTSVEPVTNMDSGIGGKKDVNAWNTPLIKPLFLMLTILVARLNKKRIKIMKLRNDEVVEGATVAIPLVAVEEAKYGLERVMLRNGFFLFQFSTREGMERVLENGLWLIRLVPLILNVWSPNTIMKKDEITMAPAWDEITMAPAWVKLHNVPIVAYSEAGLSLIATQLGSPLMLDTVEVKPVDANNSNAKPTSSGDNEDRFVKVQNRKKKGKDVSRTFSGIRLAKSKPNVHWQPKKNEFSKRSPNVESTSGTTKDGDNPPLSRVKVDLNTISNSDGDNPPLSRVKVDLNTISNSGTTKGRDNHKISSLLRVQFDLTTPVSNSFDVLNTVEELECDPSGHNPKVEEYPSYDSMGISSTGGGFSLEDDDLDCYDGYEAQVFNLSGKS
nr:hypothetical protein [Tanacetum cinerariifolium]